MKKTVIVVALGLALGACSKKEDSPTTATPEAPKAARVDLPLNFAPAGTAYVLGNFEPAPKAYVDALSPMAEKFKTAMVQTLEGLLQKESDPTGKAVLGMIKERLQQPQTMESMGLSTNPVAAVYEVAALPVLRMELADPERFKAFITEVETKVGTKLSTADLNGQAYWQLAPATEAAPGRPSSPGAVMAIVGKHLVLTVVPATETALLPKLLGIEKPAQSVVDSGELAAMNKEFGYQPYGPSALVDVRKIVGLAMPEQNNWLSRAIKDDGVVLDEVCKTELLGVAAKAPRLVMGAKSMDAKQVHVNGVLELESKIASDLQKIVAPVPALGSAKQGIEIGFGLNIEQLASFLQAQSQAVQAAPFQCEMLAPWNEFMAELPQGIAGLYSAAGFFSGARVHLETLNLEPLQITGSLLVASANPQGLLGMAMGFAPELGQLGLSADGQAKELQSPNTQAMLPGQRVWMAMSDKALGLSIGGADGKALEQTLKASAPSPTPLMYFGTDGASYAKLNEVMNDFYKRSLPPEAAGIYGSVDPLLEPLNNAIREIYRSMGTIQATYHFSNRGLELTQIATFQ